METLPLGQVTKLQEPLSQKEAVYTYVIQAIGSHDLLAGQTLKDLITKDVRKIVRTKLFNGIKTGIIKYNPSKTDSEIKKYCSGLINNWLGKDERFH